MCSTAHTKLRWSRARTERFRKRRSFGLWSCCPRFGQMSQLDTPTCPGRRSQGRRPGPRCRPNRRARGWLRRRSTPLPRRRCTRWPMLQCPAPLPPFLQCTHPAEGRSIGWRRLSTGRPGKACTVGRRLPRVYCSHRCPGHRPSSWCTLPHSESCCISRFRNLSTYGQQLWKERSTRRCLPRRSTKSRRKPRSQSS